MPKVMLDRRGDLRKNLFYRFDIPFRDYPPVDTPTPEWIVVPRTPRADQLALLSQETYAWIEMTSDYNQLVEIKDCPRDGEHVTHRYYKQMAGEKVGGKRLSPFVPNDTNEVILSKDLFDRLHALKVRNARIDPLRLVDHHTDAKLAGYWTMQFSGKAMVRIPQFVDAPNRCPHCGRGVIACEACGYWNPYCSICKKDVATLKESHGGTSDKRFSIEEDPWRVIEGKTWDGSDLVQAQYRNFVSKRFIDWLLRVHAAPFYAEPVYFCVDGMSDQQKKWFEELQKPFDV